MVGKNYISPLRAYGVYPSYLKFINYRAVAVVLIRYLRLYNSISKKDGVRLVWLPTAELA